MTQFDKLPVEIQERMLLEQERQGNPRNAEVFEKNTKADTSEGGFDWDHSVEGHDFWSDIIIYGNFDVFYEKYPKEPSKLYSEEEVRNLFIKHCKDLYNTHKKFYKFFLEQDLTWFEDYKK